MIGALEFLLEHPDGASDDEREHEVNQACDEEHLEIPEIRARRRLRLEEQLGNRNHVQNAGILDIDNELVADGRQDIAHGLRQHNACHRLPVRQADGMRGFGLSLIDGQDATTDDFGQTEAGQRRIAGDGKKLFRAQARVDLFAFRRAALITPENGGAKRPAVFVQQRDAVHLAAQADGGNGFRLHAALGDCFADAGEGRLRPVVRVLFRPAVLRREKRIGTAGAADRTQLIAVENDLHRACAKVDSE